MGMLVHNMCAQGHFPGYGHGDGSGIEESRSAQDQDGDDFRDLDVMPVG